MSVLPMSKVNIIGLKNDRKKILEYIQKIGILEVKDCQYDAGLENVDTAVAQSKFQKVKDDLLQALNILETYDAEGKSIFYILQGKRTFFRSDYEGLVAKREQIIDVARDVLNLKKQIDDKKMQILKLMDQIDELKPWQDLSIAMNIKGTDKTKVVFGTLSENYTKERITLVLKEAGEKLGADKTVEDLYVDIINTTKVKTHIAVICKKEQLEEVENVLRYIGFIESQIDCDKTPTSKIGELRKKRQEIKSEIYNCEKSIYEAAKFSDDIKFLTDYYTMRIDKYEVIEKLGQSQSTFVLSGFAPTNVVEKLGKALCEKWDVVFEHTVSSEEDNPPILLKNNSISEPLEGVLETFSLPGRGEIDPTVVMSMFYYFLFGIMLSDAGYGVLIVLACSIALWRFPKMGDVMRRALKMYLYCGISTTFWGVMFGGYFGDAVQVISTTFFNKEVVIKPLWFSPMEEPMRMLMFSLLVGIIHLFAGLGMKLYSCIKAGNLKDALYDVIFWYMLVGGAIVFLLTTKMFTDMAGLNFTLSANVGKVAIGFMIVGAIGIILTSGRSSKNPFKRIAKGMYGLYNVTGYLSDILSYSRLLALGLATGVIANVFNKMGSMFGDGILGGIAFALVFALGHTLNIGINLLGAYVHTNRLQFVEFFGKFYEGGGEKFSPFKVDTAYFEIKND
ncbi:MAG: V-type ATP synthase subunit I [Clostridia bacterium]|nr:V-type ATP synthase subunit I [Clostridia bacterium]